MFDAQVLAFVGIAAVLTITPGADTLLVMRSVLQRGRRAGFITTLGICMGLFVHAVISALGLSIILVRSATAFEIVKWVGAAYLIFLGLQSLWSALRQQNSEPSKSDVGASKGSRQAFLEGLLTNILNPKVAIFYLAFLPQFISAGDPVLAKSILLAGLHFAMGIVWLSLITLLLAQLRSVLTHPRTKRLIEGFAGTVLIGFGLRLALERR